MNTQLQTEYSLPKDSYVAFDAITLRNLILKRLDEQGIYTDHNYIGSNLASIIDIVSYAYNTLIFYLHKTSNESLFTEAQLSENINRIVKLLGYNPVGYQTSTLAFGASAGTLPPGVYTIPRFSSITLRTGQVSFNKDVSFHVTESSTAIPELQNKELLYQGQFREYATYVAAGNDSEMVLLNTGNEKVDHTNVYVFVYENQNEKWFEYTETFSLYSETAERRTFEKRLNSNGVYEIFFGNDINGKKLKAGDSIVVYYLVGDGIVGIVEPGALQNSWKAARTGRLFYTPTFNEIRQSLDTGDKTYLTQSGLNQMEFDNVVGSTIPNEAEGVESIRANAPGLFRTQNRLVTKADYTNYIKTNFTKIIADVKVFDNWDYTTKYLKYFNDISVKPQAFGQMLFNQIQYADNCNFNNVYICGLPQTAKGITSKYLLPAQKEIIKNTLDSLRTLTTEITFLEPIYKAIGFGVNGQDTLGVTEVDITQLEIIKQSSSNRTSSSIVDQVVGIFDKYFNSTAPTLGGDFKYTTLVSEILSIEGVSSIRTRRTDTKESFEGLSFLMWNPNYPDMDFELLRSNKNLLPFEYVYFYDIINVSSKIVVVSK